MCIRDSVAGASPCSMGIYTTRIGKMENDLELPPSNIFPTVSYTHLDVYKRQAIGTVSAQVILPCHIVQTFRIIAAAGNYIIRVGSTGLDLSLIHI